MHGLKVWNSEEQVRLDTNDRTMRLTDMVKVNGRMLSAKQRALQFIPIPGFNPEVDGAFLNPGEAGYLWYERDNYTGYIYMPDMQPALGGVNLSWRGHEERWQGAISYMACHVMILRAY